MNTPSRKKVLFISADQWRGDCLSAVGHPQVKTPNLDALAKDGTLFANHFTQCCPCGPARASLLTGMYAMNHRSITNGTPLDARHSNVAQEARRAGYDPTLFGYTDTSLDPREYEPGDPRLNTYEGLLPGFSEGCMFNDHRMQAWTDTLRAAGHEMPEMPTDICLPSQSPEPGQGHTRPPTVYSAEHSDTAFMADQVINFIAARQQEDWFVHAVFMRPHPPLYAPHPYNEMYNPDEMELPFKAASPEAEGAQHPFLTHWLDCQTEPGLYTGHNVNTRDLPDHELRQMRATYFGLISEVDAHIGRIIDHLKTTGEYDETLIIFTVDHGEQLGDHYLWGKGGYFDGSYHIPLIIRAPGLESRGETVQHFTEAVDIMPTILEWIDATIPRNVDGVSLVPWLKSEKPQHWRDTVHWEFDFRDLRHQEAESALGLNSEECALAVIRSDQYKYVHFTALPPLLFDLREDPNELNNLVDEPAYQDVATVFARQLLSKRMRHVDRSLTHILLGPDLVI